MTVIMPMGGKKVNWEPGKKQVVKAASSGKSSEQEVVESGSDALYEAAKAHLGKKAQFGAEVVTVDEVPGDVPAEVVDVVEDISEEVAGDDALDSVDDAAEGAEADAATEIQVAVEKIEEAVGEVKDAVEDLSDAEAAEGEEVEVEVELDDLGEEAPCDECPEGEEELVVESKDDEICESCGSVMASCSCKKSVKTAKKAKKCEKCECDPCECDDKKEEKEEKEACVASAGDEYVRYSKVSPKNQRLVRNYWKSDLGYDPEYVALMTKNYEK